MSTHSAAARKDFLARLHPTRPGRCYERQRKTGDERSSSEGDRRAGSPTRRRSEEAGADRLRLARTGEARDDSDVDLYLVVTGEEFERIPAESGCFYGSWDPARFSGVEIDGKIVEQGVLDRGSRAC